MKNIAIGILALIMLIGGGFYFFNSFENEESNLIEHTSQESDEVIVRDANANEQESSPVSLFVTPTTGIAPLTVSLIGTIGVSNDERGSAIIFFGDGTSDVMFRKDLALYEETWNYTYKQPGTYEVLLVKTTESNVDADISVMKDPNNSKNQIVAKETVIVSSE